MQFHSIVCVLAATATFACAFPSSSMATPHVLTFANGVDLTALDPLNPQAAPDYELNWITMAYLVRYGARGYVPDLATVVPSRRNGGVSADGKTLTYHLRPNLRWSDGAPLTSDDIKFTVGLINDPKTNTLYREGFQFVTSVDTPDPATAIFHLTRSYGIALATYFSARSAPILPKHLLDGTAYGTSAYVQLPVGAGPFRYTRWQRGDRVELEPNPYFYGGKPKLTKIVCKLIPDNASTLVELRTGAVDFVPTVTYADYKPLENLPQIHVQISRGVRPSLLALNLGRPLLADPAVRRALLLATDRLSILQRSYLGGGVLSENAVSLADPYRARIARVPYDPRAANQLLDRAGWKRGPDGVRSKDGARLHLESIGATGSTFVDQILELTRVNWTAIGVEVETKRYPLSLMFAKAEQGGILFGSKYDVALFSFAEVPSDQFGDTLLCRARPPSGRNLYDLCDRALDAVVDRGDAAYDPAVFGPLRERAQQIAAADVYAIVLALRNEYNLYSDNVAGLDIEPFAFFPDVLKLDVTR